MSKQSPTTLQRLQPLDQGMNDLLHQAEETVVKTYRDFEKCVKQSPTKSLLTAVAAGYVLHRLPLRAILVAKVRILSALAPPALLLLGAAKLYEFIQEESDASRPQ